MEVIKKVTINPTIPANQLTSIRAVANLFKNSFHYNWLQKHRSEVSTSLLFISLGLFKGLNKKLRIAWKSNISVGIFLFVLEPMYSFTLMIELLLRSISIH